MARNCRVGNYIGHSANTIFQIGNIYLSKLEWFVDELANKDNGEYRMSELFGIHLTPEILEKSGFTQLTWGNLKTDEYAIGKNFVLCKVGGNHSIYQLQFETRMCQVLVEYLHELQNLYHTLTQKELTINL